jgi:hypothetical protein
MVNHRCPGKTIKLEEKKGENLESKFELEGGNFKS